MSHGLAICKAMASLIGRRLPKAAQQHLFDHPDDFVAAKLNYSLEWDGPVTYVLIGKTDKHNEHGETWRWVLQKVGNGKPRLTCMAA